MVCSHSRLYRFHLLECGSGRPAEVGSLFPPMLVDAWEHRMEEDLMRTYMDCSGEVLLSASYAMVDGGAVAVTGGQAAKGRRRMTSPCQSPPLHNLHIPQLRVAVRGSGNRYLGHDSEYDQAYRRFKIIRLCNQ
ncbi:hypothetical protein BHM03_00009885 [Ensete ventricosum]|uniref:Uncharacterized protein n=1 Tax=Ensete ventricosum TaxID=4639 RepID=A0A445MCU9_ENSVE|nr:hypothetical protein BHM03_00009885 [Ensete ventricosum]